MLDLFRALYQGGEYGYGEWDIAKGAKTLRGPVPLEAYQNHLSGKVGLGLVPIRKDSTCLFGAIDIDIDNINHLDLVAKVVKRRLPLTVCRSKSGGAHCYVFFKEPTPASKVQQLLKKWATILGHPSSEIFPKQSQISTNNIGNWINLPYFGGDNTTRYAFGENGALSLSDFLASVKHYDPAGDYDEGARIDTDGMPPCLAALSEHKLPEGTRNTVLFNVAVFYRKSAPTTWEDAVNRHNQTQFNPSLSYREVQSVIKSAGRTRYQYTCEQFPLRDHCNRNECQKLPYGVAHMPWKEEGAFDDLLVTRLRKILSEPPRYVLEVNGKDMELSAEDFINYRKFKTQVFMKMDLMIRDLKQPQWEQQIRALTETKEDVATPEDASTQGLILQRVHEFLALRERSVGRDDILRGLPVVANDQILFRASDLIRHLQIYKLDTKMELGELFLFLKKHGADHKRVRANGKVVQVWSFPLVNTNDQTEDFAVADFAEAGEEEL